MTTTTAHSTHLQAEQTREHEQDFLKALAQADVAFDSYVKEGNMYGAAEALCSRTITLRHLANQPTSLEHGRNAYLLQALHAAQASVAIATTHAVSSAIPYLNLGKVQSELGMNDVAIESFQKAVEEQSARPHETQNRPGVLANFQEILASAQLAMGDTSALARAEKALQDLESANEDDYNKAVWLLHGHARIARACVSFDREAAQKHYQAAKTLFASRTDLALSQKTLDDLKDIA